MTDLTPRQWERVEALFEQALEMAAEDRPAYLDQNCLDAAVRAEVESLLAVQPRAVRFMDTPALERDVGRELRETLRETGRGLVGETIGRYTIRRIIATGGMGTVYEAEQSQPKRAVALKVISPGVATPGLIRRFEQEAEVLGYLQHPGIAQIYDAGTFDLGAGSQPYFAMELIRGKPLTEYAEHNRLGTRQRMELFVNVCAAVHHAHQRGVIHRDLKPGNILVVDVAGTGQPKVLDFGVARATNADIQTATLRTDIGQLVGTVPYMSPEQATGRPGDVDVRSDVYSLGVVLYELLSGRLPYNVRDKMIHEAVRMIREDDPTPLSSVNPAFRGDIETILIKALEKEKDRRYESAAALQADLERYLHDEPITARPPSAMYQLGKFAKRNKTLVSAAAAVLVMLVIGIAVTSYMAIEQARLRDEAEARRREAVSERDRARAAEKTAEERRHEAERQTRIAEAVNMFLNEDLLGSVDPRRTANPDLTVREVLDRAAENIEGRFEGDPLVEAAVRVTLAETYRHLGEHRISRRHIERAVRLREAALGADAPDTLRARVSLAIAYNSAGRYSEALRIHEEVYDAYVARHGGEHAETTMQMNNIAMVYWALGRIEDAVELLERALAIRLEILPEDDPSTVTVMQNLGKYYLDLSRYRDAESMMRRTLGFRRERYGDDHPHTIAVQADLARALNLTGRHEEARDLARDALARSRRVLGDEHGTTLTAMGSLAGAYENLQAYDDAERLYVERLERIRADAVRDQAVPARALNDLALFYQRQGRFSEARPLLEEAIELYRATLGDHHLYTMMVTGSLGELYMQLNLVERAEPLFRSVLAARRDMLGEYDPQTLTAMVNVGWALMRRGRHAEAEPFYRQALEGRRKALPENHPHTLLCMVQLGNLLQIQKKYDEAEPLVVEAYEANESLHGPTHPDTLVALSVLSLFYAEQGKFEQAEPLAREALQRSRAAMPEGHWFTGVFLMRHGECLAQLGRHDEAETKLLEGFEIISGVFTPDHPRAAQARQTIAAFYRMIGEPDKATAWDATGEDATSPE